MKNARNYSPLLHLGLKLAYPTHPDVFGFERNQGHETELEPRAGLGGKHGSLERSGWATCFEFRKLKVHSPLWHLGQILEPWFPSGDILVGQPTENSEARC